MGLKFNTLLDKASLSSSTEKDLYHVFLVDKDNKTYTLEVATVSDDVALATVSVYTRIDKPCICIYKKGSKLFTVDQSGNKLLF